MSFAYHGNYCGPGWTDNQYKNSQEGVFNIPSIDEFDQTCKLHDESYKAGDYLSADKVFVRDNLGKSFKRNAAAVAVYLQAQLRELGLMAKSKSVKKQITQVKNELEHLSVGRTKPNKKGPGPKIKMSQSSKPKGPPVIMSVGPLVGKSVTKVDGKNISNRTVVSGHDQLGGVDVPPNTTVQPGTVLFEFTVSPQNFTDQRLGIFSTLFDKYRFTTFSIKYRPQVGTNVGGELILWYDYDPTDDPPTGVTGVNNALASSSVKTVAVWDKINGVNMQAKLCKGEFYTSPGAELRLVNQAKFYVTTNSLFQGGTTGLTLGNLEVSYRVEFFGNELNPVGDLYQRTQFTTLSNIGALLDTTNAYTTRVIPIETRGAYSFKNSIKLNENYTRAAVRTFFNKPGLYKINFHFDLTSTDAGQYFPTSDTATYQYFSDFDVTDSNACVVKSNYQHALDVEGTTQSVLSSSYIIEVNRTGPNGHFAIIVNLAKGFNPITDNLRLFEFTCTRIADTGYAYDNAQKRDVNAPMKELQSQLDVLRTQIEDLKVKDNSNATPKPIVRRN